MKQNNWENTRLGIYHGANTLLGSPRGWLQRAVELKQAETSWHETSLDPRKITVAGVWRRPCHLPDTGSWPALYRYFRITDNLRRPTRAKSDDFYAVIGMAVAVPDSDIYAIYQQYRQTAEWVWMDWSVPPRKTRAVNSMRELDHAEIYQLFDQNLTVRQVSDRLNLSVQSVGYVHKKWQKGLPPERTPRKTQDRDSVLADLRSGMRIVDVARKYDCSRTQIYNIQRQRNV